LEEGLYLWQTIIINLKKKKCLLYKLLNNKICYAFCTLFRWVKTNIKRVIKAKK